MITNSVPEEAKSTKRVLRGNNINAVYRESTVDAYRYNPYIEALPPIFGWEDIAMRIDRMPSYNAAERLLSPTDRLQFVQTIDNFILPLPAHIDLANRISRMIRHGYMVRNPLEAQWKKQMRLAFKGLYWDEKNEYEPLIRSTAAGFTVIGCSGIGKSTTVESVLGLYPQVIQHTQYDGVEFIQRQVVWLKLDCPKDGSLRSMCLNFFQAIDNVLGTRYRNMYKKESVDVLIDSMEHVASIFGVGVLVIDEIQNLNEAKRNDVQVVLNALVKLINTIGVPVLLVGTNRALDLLSRDFATARRSAGQGDVVWTNMIEGDEWEFFIHKLWEFQWTNIVTPLTPKLIKTLYDESQGIIDIAIKLYKLVQWHVIGQENEKITSSLIRQVAKESLRLAKPMLEALRSKDQDKLANYSDLIIDIDSYLRKAKVRVSFYGSNNSLLAQYKALKTENDLKNSPLYRIIKWLMDFGIDQKIAMDSAQKALEIHATDTNITNAMHYALQISNGFLSEDKSKPEVFPKKKKRSSTLLNQDEMIEIIDGEKCGLEGILENDDYS